MLVVNIWGSIDESYHYQWVCRNDLFRIFTPDLSLSMWTWVEVKILGDKKLLLLGDGGALCEDVAVFLEYRFRPDCVYFTEAKGKCDVYIWYEFSLEEKRIKLFSGPSSWFVKSLLHLIKPEGA